MPWIGALPQTREPSSRTQELASHAILHSLRCRQNSTDERSRRSGTLMHPRGNRTHPAVFCSVLKRAGGKRKEATIVIGDARKFCANCTAGEQFLGHLKRLHVLPQLVLFAFDFIAYSYGIDRGIHSILWEPRQPQHAVPLAPHHLLSPQKFGILSETLRCGIRVLITDVDVAFFGDPWAYAGPMLDEHEAEDPVDVMPMSDGVDRDGIFGIAKNSKQQTSSCCGRFPMTIQETRLHLFNSGFFFVRPSRRTERAFQFAFEASLTEPVWDQAVFNWLFLPLGSGRGFGLRARVLQAHLFANSHFYDNHFFDHQMHQRDYKKGVPFIPVVLHANFIAKTGSLKEAYLVKVWNQSRHLPLPPKHNLSFLDAHWDDFWKSH